MANEIKIICKNVFKNEGKEALRRGLTSKWIVLINQYENIKGMTDAQNK